MQNLFLCVAAPLQGQIVRFPEVAMQVHDAAEYARLVEHGSEYCGVGNVAIDLKYGVIAE
jgi:hypothetical protein